MSKIWNIILASASPRRKELLSALDLTFCVDARSHFEENIPEGMACEQIPIYLSEGKSMGFHRKLEENELLITADTLVFSEGKALGKPHDKEEAIAMLAALSGKTHQVTTGVCLRSQNKMISFSDTTQVHFTDLTEAEIAYYVERYNPIDKAGAYGIQEWIGMATIDTIEGSYFNVMGLPTALLWHKLKSEFGIQLP